MKKLGFGLLVTALALGMTVIGCAQDEANAIQGSWVYEDGWEEFVVTFNNGNFEFRDGGEPYIRGTYTVSGDTITLRVTHEGNWGGDGWDALDADDIDEEEMTFYLDGDSLILASDAWGSPITFTRR